MGVVFPVSEGSQYLQPIHLRQPQIQHDQVVSSGGRQAEALHPIANQVGMITLFLEPALHVLAYGAIVLDYQDFHASTGR